MRFGIVRFFTRSAPKTTSLYSLSKVWGELSYLLVIPVDIARGGLHLLLVLGAEEVLDNLNG